MVTDPWAKKPQVKLSKPSEEQYMSVDDGYLTGQSHHLTPIADKTYDTSGYFPLIPLNESHTPEEQPKVDSRGTLERISPSPLSMNKK